jgi:CRP-like cAMP-binding protein
MNAFNVVKLQSKAVLFSEGSVADRFYIIREGKVQVSHTVPGSKAPVSNSYGPGDFLGEMSAMSAHSYIETAAAEAESLLLCIKRDQFPVFIQGNVSIALKIVTQFSKRIRSLNESLAHQVTTKESAEDYEPSFLYVQGDYYARQDDWNAAYFMWNQYLKYYPKGILASSARKEIQKIGDKVKKQHESKPTDFVRTYKKDEFLFAESEAGGEMYVIQKGTVKVTKIVDEKELLLAILKSGDIIGEMAILEQKPRSANAVAGDDTEVFTIDKANFAAMVSKQPQIVTKLTASLAERIWFLHKQLMNRQIADPVERIYNMLATQLERHRVAPSIRGYVYDFGFVDLVNMIGLDIKEANQAIHTVLGEKLVSDAKGLISISSIAELFRRNEIYWKLQRTH